MYRFGASLFLGMVKKCSRGYMIELGIKELRSQDLASGQQKEVVCGALRKIGGV